MKEFLGQYAVRTLGVRPQTAEMMYRYIQKGMDDRRDGFQRSKPGPGGAARSTAFSCAFMIVAAMSGGAKVDVFQQAWSCWLLPPEHSDSSILGAEMFGDAFEAVLADALHAKAVERIDVFLTHPAAAIHWRSGKTDHYGMSHDIEMNARGLTRLASIDGDTLRSIEAALRPDRLASSS
ncbi:hypothetical protein [Roseomonas sp. WA12]